MTPCKMQQRILPQLPTTNKSSIVPTEKSSTGPTTNQQTRVSKIGQGKGSMETRQEFITCQASKTYLFHVPKIHLKVQAGVYLAFGYCLFRGNLGMVVQQTTTNVANLKFQLGEWIGLTFTTFSSFRHGAAVPVAKTRLRHVAPDGHAVDGSSNCTGSILRQQLLRVTRKDRCRV